MTPNGDISPDKNPLNTLGKTIGGEHEPKLPPPEKMVSFGMDMLQNSSIGMELVNFASANNITVKITRGREETSYVPDDQQVVISLDSSKPAQPARFVLLLAGALRDIMQNYEGLRQPSVTENMSIILEKMREKQGDKVAYMCAVAYEINELSSFSEYNLIEELKDMGYAKDVDVFLQNL